MSTLLRTPIAVALDQLYLDPNNPRLAREERPGYANPAAFFGEEAQLALEGQLRHRYRLAGLVRAILGMGWLPVDAILVWEPPQMPGRYLVIEGNTRVVALRTICRGLERETARLLRARALGDGAQMEDAADRVARHERVVRACEAIEVRPVEARSPAELAETTPPLLGVRHLAHAQEWSAWAVNLYLLSLYRQIWAAEHGRAPLRLEEAILARVAANAALSASKARRAIQTATAFLHFRDRFFGQGAGAESLTDDHQAFFARLLEPGHARVRFRIGDDDLALATDMEEVLRRWAFSQPRILRSADDIRLWNRLARYDVKHHTGFAARLDPEQPERARPMAETELDYLAHRGAQSPVEALRGLVERLRHLDLATLRSQREEIAPLVEEVLHRARDCQAALAALQAPS
jgi:hypothetical protein